MAGRGSIEVYRKPLRRGARSKYVEIRAICHLPGPVPRAEGPDRLRADDLGSVAGQRVDGASTQNDWTRGSSVCYATPRSIASHNCPGLEENETKRRKKKDSPAAVGPVLYALLIVVGRRGARQRMHMYAWALSLRSLCFLALSFLFCALPPTGRIMARAPRDTRHVGHQVKHSGQQLSGLAGQKQYL